MKTYSCLHCGKEAEATHQKRNKFCSLKCGNDYRYEQWIKEWKAGNQDGLSYQGLQTSKRIKRYIVDKFDNTCQGCGLKGEWNGKPITLQLEHLDGNSRNNAESNLSLLCPNCHTQTEFYGSKNKGRGRHALLKEAVAEV